MALRASYTTLSPEFDSFLFASIGEESNGMSLSVISAFTRLNIDPWSEAARLSHLSKEGAAEVLGPILARLPIGGRVAVDIPAIARRLVDFLPRDGEVVQAVATRPAANKVRSRVIYAVMLLVLAVFYFGLVARHQPPLVGDTAPAALADAPHH